MIYLNRRLYVLASLIGLGLGSMAVSGGCSGSSEPVPTEEAKKAEMKQMQDIAEANDAASKSARSSRPRAGVMPP